MTAGSAGEVRLHRYRYGGAGLGRGRRRRGGRVRGDRVGGRPGRRDGDVHVVHVAVHLVEVAVNRRVVAEHDDPVVALGDMVDPVRVVRVRAREGQRDRPVPVRPGGHVPGDGGDEIWLVIAGEAQKEVAGLAVVQAVAP